MFDKERYIFDNLNRLDRCRPIVDRYMYKNLHNFFSICINDRFFLADAYTYYSFDRALPRSCDIQGMKHLEVIKNRFGQAGLLKRVKESHFKQFSWHQNSTSLGFWCTNYY